MRVSIRWKLVLAIGIPLLLIYAVMLTVMIEQIRVRAHAELEAGIAELVENHAARVDARFEHVARAADATATALGTLSRWTKEDAYSLLERDVAVDPMVWSSHLVVDGHALGLDDATLAAFVGRREGGGLVHRDLVLEGVDYAAQEWASAPRQTGQSGWSEPYIERMQTGSVALSSYFTPVYHGDEIVGAVTADVALDDIEDHFDWIEFEGGEFAIVTPEGWPISRPERDYDESENLFSIAKSRGRADVTDALERMRAGETGVLQAEGLLIPGKRWMTFAPMPTTGWSYVAVVEEDALLAFSRSQLQLGLGILLAGLAVILFLLLFMATRITRPIGRLAGAVRHLGAGDLETRVTGITSKDEIGDLAQGFNRMVSDLKTHVDALTRETAARQAVESEMRVGREIQASMLPSEFPRHEAYELHAVNIPARHVAGDFYDWFHLDDGTLAFLIADVSGKGVPAALFMAVARTVIRQVCATAGSLVEAVSQANTVLEGAGISSMYVTLVIGWYDAESGRLRYICGGNPPGYRVDSTGRVKPFGEVTGPPVGLLPGRTFEERTEQLSPGDCVVWFTDGVPEAEGPDGEFYGDERLQTLLSELGGRDAAALCAGVAARIAAYEAGSPHDDVTLLAFRRR